MGDSQSLIVNLREIQQSTFVMLTRLKGADDEATQDAVQEYIALVDRFRQVSDHLAPQQYEAAMEDVEYFLRLLDLAVAYEAMGEQS